MNTSTHYTGPRVVFGQAPRRITLERVRRMPATVDVVTAGAVLGLGRTKSYALAKRGDFPCRVLKLGRSYRVSTAELLKLLGADTAGEAGTA